jgi:hypothetical protein
MADFHLHTTGDEDDNAKAPTQPSDANDLGDDIGEKIGKHEEDPSRQV